MTFHHDSSKSLSLDDIAEADASAGRSRPPHHAKEGLEAWSSSLPLVNETDPSDDAPDDTLTKEQRQAKRRASYLLRPRKKERHHFVFAAELMAEIEAELDSDDDLDDD